MSSTNFRLKNSALFVRRRLWSLETIPSKEVKSWSVRLQSNSSLVIKVLRTLMSSNSMSSSEAISRSISKFSSILMACIGSFIADLATRAACDLSLRSLAGVGDLSFVFPCFSFSSFFFQLSGAFSG